MNLANFTLKTPLSIFLIPILFNKKIAQLYLAKFLMIIEHLIQKVVSILFYLNYSMFLFGALEQIP